MGFENPLPLYQSLYERLLLRWRHNHIFSVELLKVPPCKQQPRVVVTGNCGRFANELFRQKSCERWRTEILAEDGRSWTRQTQKTKTQQSFRYLGYWPPNTFPTSSFECFLWGVFCCWIIHLVFVFLIHAIFSSCRSYQLELCNTVIRNKVTLIAKIKGKSTKTT